DRNGGVIAHFDYDDEDGWPGRPDGGGSGLEHLGGDYADPANWRASAAIHGTPGEEPPTTSPVVVNEVVTSGGKGLPGAIELHSPSESPVDLGGSFLSASASPVTADDLRQYRIPEGTTLPAGGYLVIDEAQFNPNGG